MAKPDRQQATESQRCDDTINNDDIPKTVATSGRYQYSGGLRRVAPYFFTYNTYCKERWRERKLLDVFESEFREKTIEYYSKAIQQGAVLVNGKHIGLDYILRNGDLISHLTHRHEPPVSPHPIGIIYEDDDMIVIDKPSGIPVHPAGRYKFNTVLEIMKSQRGMADGILYPCNRLDRLTSGLMFVAKSATAAEKMCKQILDRKVRKEYVARVLGKFPDGEVVCDQPILQIAPKVGLNRVRATGKAARTIFKRLAYYPHVQTETSYEYEGDGGDFSCYQTSTDSSTNHGGYSIIRAMPVTGRTHQIRVHLQYLGHPVENDPIYANRRVWGRELGFDDADGSRTTDEDIVERLSRMGKDEVADAVAYYDQMVDSYHNQCAEKMSGEFCNLCGTPLYTDPGDQELSLWLHSFRYEDIDGSWQHQSSLPPWALPPNRFISTNSINHMP